ncbi:MAG TPA: hypothetical protein VHB77_14710 [Planctomycetaceae bacterium]|nr:hypothetical protein [Planctomycetaceae bacterium]
MDPASEIADDVHPVKRPGMLVLLAGIFTSLGTLAGLYALNIVAPDVNVMGWYADGVIPIGAILVGFIAGSGYGVASWLTGSKIGSGLMWKILFLQIGCYFLAQYVEFLILRNANALPPAVTFWEYFDVITRSFAWEDHGKPGQPFGVWGYGMRAFEIAGFALSGLIAPTILFSVPYCDACQIYMRTEDLGRLPAGVTVRKIKKKDTEGQQAYAAEQQAALQQGQQHLEALLATVGANDPQRFVQLIHEHAPRKKEIEAQTTRLAVSLQRCRGCHCGNLVVKLNAGHGKEIVVTDVSKTALPPDFVRNVVMYRADLRAS